MNRKLFEVLSTFFGLIVGISCLVGVFGFFMMMSGDLELRGAGFKVVLFSVVIAGGLIYFSTYIEKSANDEFVKYVEEHGGADYIVKGYFSGLAINKKHRIIFLNEDYKSTSYSLDDVRSWTNQNSSGGEVLVSFGSAVNISDRINIGAQVAGTQIASNHRKLHNTGVKVEVRSLAQPLWMIKLRKDIDRNQCAELLQQVINEA